MTVDRHRARRWRRWYRKPANRRAFRARIAQRYRDRLAAGLCGRCGDPNDRAPRVKCSGCATEQSLKEAA